MKERRGYSDEDMQQTWGASFRCLGVQTQACKFVLVRTILVFASFSQHV